MNNLKEYITEKLRINKDTKTEKFKSVEEKIMKMACLDPNGYDKERSAEVMAEIKDKWIDTFDITDVDCIVNSTMEREWEYLNLYVDEFIVDDDLYNKIDESKEGRTNIYRDDALEVNVLYKKNKDFNALGIVGGDNYYLYFLAV